MQMLEFIEELAKKICEIELCVSNLSSLRRLPILGSGAVWESGFLHPRPSQRESQAAPAIAALSWCASLA